MSLVKTTQPTKNALLASHNNALTANNGMLQATTEIEVPVDPQSLEATVNVIMNEPPVDTSTSKFELDYVYTSDSGQTKGQKLSDCTYKYDIATDYVDLSSATEVYKPTIEPKPRILWESRESFDDVYQSEVLNNGREILAQDMYYTVSKHVMEAKAKTEGEAGYLDPKSTIGLYLNDIATYSDGGIWLRVNFNIKSKKFIPFAGQVFTDVDATFQITLDTGYKVTLQDEADGNNAWKVSVGLKTRGQNTSSHGRFKGSFKCNGQEVNNYDGVVNYASTTVTPTQPIHFASWFATGGMAWIFNAESSSGKNMNYYTWYGKNLPALGALGTVNVDGTPYVFYDLEESGLCTTNASTKIVLKLASDETQTKEFARNEFNYKITFDSRLKTIPDGFLFQCTKFNSEIDMEQTTQLKTIGSGFMYGCSAFTKFINLVPCSSSLTSIGDLFMSYCSAWNNEEFGLTLPDTLTTIGAYFLCGTSYCGNPESERAALTIPANVSFVGGNFLYNTLSMNGKTIEVNCLAKSFVYGPYWYSFCSEGEGAEGYTIYIKGNVDFDALKSNFADENGERQGASGEPLYRHIRQAK